MEGYGGPAQPSPTIGQCLSGGLGWLEVACNRCKTRASLPLDAIRRPRDTPIWKLEASLKCRSCRKGRYAPPVRMVKLTGHARDHALQVGSSARGLLTAWPLWQRGLAELMFFRSTPGRMGNLLIPITAPRNQIGLQVRDLGVTLYRRRIHVRLQLTCGRDTTRGGRGNFGLDQLFYRDSRLCEPGRSESRGLPSSWDRDRIRE